MKIIELEQNTDAWLEFRKGKIGASDAPIVMGVSPWCTALQLWERKLDIASDQTESYAMTRGKELEQQARWMFEEGKGMQFLPAVIQHKEHDFLIASLDGLSNCKKYALEIKCPGKEDHELALKGTLPPKYIPQLQHQLEVTGLDMIYYYSYDGKNNACIEVKRDQSYIDKMMVELKKFHKCMVTCTPPELIDCDYNIRNDDEWKFYVDRWIEDKHNLACWEAREMQSRKELIEASQSHNSKGFGVKVQKITRNGSVDYSQIKELQGVDLDQYRKPTSESWRITMDGE